MNKKQLLLQLIPEQGLLPLYFHKDASVSAAVLRALYGAGIRAVEYTNRGAEALENFAQLRTLCDHELQGMYLGIGTIKNETAALQFVDAGADFIISPGIVPAAAAVADKNNLLWVPGCMTATEIITAETMGALFVKLFPGDILGPGYMAAIRDIFPGLSFMPTGGVETTRESISAWFKAGVAAVGMGSKLLSKELMAAENYTGIQQNTAAVLEIIKTVRN